MEEDSFPVVFLDFCLGGERSRGVLSRFAFCSMFRGFHVSLLIYSSTCGRGGSITELHYRLHDFEKLG